MLKILIGDVMEQLATLPDNSAQCCVTSPPYWGLRDYGTAKWEGGDEGCDHKQSVARHDGGRANINGFHVSLAIDSDKGAMNYRDLCGKCGATRIDNQIGLDKTPELYVEKMVAVFWEVRRVLRDDGTCWVNLGDSYVANRGNTVEKPGHDNKAVHSELLNRVHKIPGKPKDLVGIPWRVAFALQADGWYLRSDIIWCLSGGTWLYVKSQKGEMPMMVRDMARLDPATVKLWNGAKWTQVLGWNKNERSGQEIEIVLRSGERISCTPMHKWPTKRGLLTAAELRCGDILQEVKLPEPQQPREASAITPDVAWLLGLYLAEGSRSEDTIQIAGHADEISRIEKLRSIVGAFGGSLTFTLAGNKLDIRIYSRVLTAIIDDHVSGKTALDKGLKVRCWSYDNGWLMALLTGYLEGDGHLDSDNQRWCLGFARNYNLERDLRVMAARLSACLTLNLSTATNQDGEFPTFRGEIRFVRSGHWNEKPRTEIVEIRKARCREVYDIGVEDDPHVFALASGILTHNSKPNPMPESVTDRPTKSHEYIFLLAKKEKYYFDQDAVREPATNDRKRGPNNFAASKEARGTCPFPGGLTEYRENYKDPDRDRNIRTVWTMATQPYPDAHFATFPEELAKRCILAGTSGRGCCPNCGAPWERVTERNDVDQKANETIDHNGVPGLKKGTSHDRVRSLSGSTYQYVRGPTVGWQPTCACGIEETKPCTVLDPFAGSGTTLKVALELGRQAVEIELNQEYAKMIERRCQTTIGMAF